MIYIVEDKRNHVKTAVIAGSRREALAHARHTFKNGFITNPKIRAKIKKIYP